jgi:hypothetical protein
VSYGIEKGREFTGRGEQKGNEAEGKRKVTKRSQEER